MKGSITTEDGTTLFVRDWGTGQPIVFISAAMLCSDQWALQMLRFSQTGFRCVAYDRRGHGRSSDPGGDYDYDTMAEDLSAVLDAKDLRNAVLVAHSAGCGDVVRYFTRFGTNRVQRAVLLAPTTPCLRQSEDNPGGIPQAYFDAQTRERSADFGKWMDKNEPAFFLPDTSEGARRAVRQMMHQTSLQAATEYQRSAFSADFRPELKNVRIPTLVIHGMKDVSAPFLLTGKVTAAGIPNCKLITYDDAPHALFLTHAERLNGDLRDFIGTNI